MTILRIYDVPVQNRTELYRCAKTQTQAVSGWFPTPVARVRVRAEHVVCVVDKEALG
jgi:hypothetical protein